MREPLIPIELTARELKFAGAAAAIVSRAAYDTRFLTDNPDLCEAAAMIQGSQPDWFRYIRKMRNVCHAALFPEGC